VSAAGCLLDSNILIRWVQPANTDYPVVAAALESLARQGADFCYTSQNLGEFWNACTRPAERNGFGLSPAETDRRAALFESRLRLLPESFSVHREWRRLLVSYSVSGIQVHNARLVASMQIHGVQRILTFNAKDFLRFEDVEALTPKSVLVKF
jgi:predicted nucleic acid-binding protein